MSYDDRVRKCERSNRKNMQPATDQATTIFDTRIFAFQKPAAPAKDVSGLYYHLAFRSNADLNLIEADRRRKFFGFIFGCTQNLLGTIETVGGRGDSMHLLVRLDSSQTPADFIKKIKLFSAAWARRKFDLPDFRWLDEEVSTVSRSECRRVASFIQSQGFLF